MYVAPDEDSVDKVCSVYFADLNFFNHRYWTKLQEQAQFSGDAGLTRLVDVLKKTAFLSKADGTVVNYTNSLKRWAELAKSKSLVVFPASVVDIALFISHLSVTYASASVIETSYCALKWVIEIAGVVNPMSNSFIKNIVEWVKRQHAKPVTKKTPIFSEVLEACCLKYDTCNDLPVRRDISMALLLFAGFFRFSEVAALTVQDIVISETYLH